VKVYFHTPFHMSQLLKHPYEDVALGLVIVALVLGLIAWLLSS